MGPPGELFGPSRVADDRREEAPRELRVGPGRRRALEARRGARNRPFGGHGRKGRSRDRGSRARGESDAAGIPRAPRREDAGRNRPRPRRDARALGARRGLASKRGAGALHRRDLARLSRVDGGPPRGPRRSATRVPSSPRDRGALRANRAAAGRLRRARNRREARGMGSHRERLRRRDREGGAARPLPARLHGRADVLDGGRSRRRYGGGPRRRRRRVGTGKGVFLARAVPLRRRAARDLS